MDQNLLAEIRARLELHELLGNAQWAGVYRRMLDTLYTFDMSQSPPHPMQPMERDEKGVVRFKQNAIVRHLLDFASKHGCSLNELSCMDFPDEDRVQLAQLIGYSFSGFSELHYVSDRDYEAAKALYDGLPAAKT